MGMADANRRINLTAPLLSVRRHGVGGAETAGTELPLSAYKPGAATSSEPPGRTSAVPFGWEHRPGHPKSVRTRRPPPPPPHPLTIVGVVDEPSRCARDEARRSDALSRDDAASCATANCSAMGLSDAASAGAGPGSSEPRGRASGGAMMDRFLPAALAVAAGSPQNAFRKAAGPAPRTAAVALGARAAGGGARLLPAQRRVPLHHIAAYHYLPPVPPAPCSPRGKTDGDGADSDARSTAGFASRRCGLLSVRCVRSALLLSRRRAGRPFRSSGGERGSRREKKPLLPPRSRNGQQQLPRTGDDHGMISQQCWEEVYIKSLLRSGRGSLMGPAAAVASELDRTVWELYSRRRDEHAARPKASHLGLLLVLDRSNNEACGNAASPARKFSITGGDTALLLEGATAKSLPNGEKQLGRDDAAADTGGGGGYGFPLLLDDKEGVAGREVALSPQPQPLLPLPLPKSPTESWLARALPSVSTRPPTTSFLGLHVQPRKHAPLPWCSVDSSRDVHHDRQRQIRVHDLQK